MFVYDNHLELVEPKAVPSWQDPAPIRTQRKQGMKKIDFFLGFLVGVVLSFPLVFDFVMR